ncbi:YkgJ family cysteine cluster protein [Nanoarchaeota archaeon]
MIRKDMSLKEVQKFIHDCNCTACEHGCKYGSGILIGEDKEKLAKFLGIKKEDLEKKYLEKTEQFGRIFLRPKIKRNGKPYGKCVFFRENKGCKIHDVKPLQCRLAMGCKDYGEDLMLWFMENYLVDKKSALSKEQYKIYLKSGGKKLK